MLTNEFYFYRKNCLWDSKAQCAASALVASALKLLQELIPAGKHCSLEAEGTS